MKQSFERAFAHYGDLPTENLYTSADGLEVYVGVPEKVNVAPKQQSRTNPLAVASSNDAQKDSTKPASAVDNFQVASSSRTRDLVFEDEDEDDGAPVVEDSTANNVTGEPISVKATVELTRDGNVTTTLPTEQFKSGDKVRLLFSANRDGYVYWLTKGTSGLYQVLFPNSKAGQDNLIVKNNQYTVPFKGAWRFDDNKGTETLVCLLSTERIASIDEAIKLADSGDQTSSSAIVAELLGGHETKRTTTRDLVFEEEDEGDVNTKTQVSNDGDAFVATYELEHI
jgi:hypothetical protein